MLNENISTVALILGFTFSEYEDCGNTLNRSQLLNEVLSPSVELSSVTNCSNGNKHESQNLVSVGSFVCRICHHPGTENESLISPCSCKGTLAYVHLSCLERWLNESSRNHCELCQHVFDAIKTPRYQCFESMRLWLKHPQNRHHAQSDLLVLFLLTLVTTGLVVVCILGMRHFIIEGRKIGISRLHTQGSIMFFLAIVVLGYCITVYFLVKEQLVPWYTWWKSSVDVRLVVEPQLCQSAVQIQKVFTDTSTVNVDNM